MIQSGIAGFIVNTWIVQAAVGLNPCTLDRRQRQILRNRVGCWRRGMIERQCTKFGVHRIVPQTGRPYEELLRERLLEEKAFWESYDGDRSLVGILRSRFHRMGKR